MTPNCRPYDLFSLAGPSAEALAYVQTPGFQTGEYLQTIVTGTMTGDLGQYGVKTPWTEEGVGVAMGAEYRRERLDLNTDIAFQTGDLRSGRRDPPVAVPTTSTNCSARPAFPDHPGSCRSSTACRLELGYRWSDYSHRLQHQTPTSSPVTGPRSRTCACAPASTVRSGARTSSSCSDDRTSLSTVRHGSRAKGHPPADLGYPRAMRSDRRHGRAVRQHLPEHRGPVQRPSRGQP
jgi:hypothetical protein